jgi:integrase
MARGSIDTRGKNKDRHRIRIYLGKGPDGKKKYHTETVRGTRRQAEKRRTEILRNLDTGGFVERNEMNLKQYFEYWLNTGVRPYRAARTVETYEEATRRIAALKGHVPLQSLTPLDCQEYYSWALTRGRGRDKEGRWRGYSESTVAIDHRTLHKALEDAVSWGLLARNVASVVPNKPKTQHRTRAVWTRQEAARFLEYTKNHRLYAYFVLALTAGLRRAELCGLKRSSLRLEDLEIDIEHTLVEVSEEGGSRLILQEHQAKTEASLAPVRLSPAVVSILKKHLARQARERLLMGSRYRDQGYVFCDINGSPLRPKNLTKLFPALCERAGVPVIRLHDTRHTFVTQLLLDRVPPQVVQRLARHTRWETTVDMYGHATKYALAEHASALDDILPSGKESTNSTKTVSEISPEDLTNASDVQ